ncbi:hypothetical protein LMG31506_00180 [Cupriavidus yeoncheonensis]|uniref:Uncharacterized protein n=1 Tax=Cupriavidus yeoncheonensis TaxID=1462994 RepID=A0A916N1D1_9BURK|nr:hypothetical protein LMG31506_00180 [Cupriavidus yeoncheonensis]
MVWIPWRCAATQSPCAALAPAPRRGGPVPRPGLMNAGRGFFLPPRMRQEPVQPRTRAILSNSRQSHLPCAVAHIALLTSLLRWKGTAGIVLPGIRRAFHPAASEAERRGVFATPAAVLLSRKPRSLSHLQGRRKTTQWKACRHLAQDDTSLWKGHLTGARVHRCIEEPEVRCPDHRHARSHSAGWLAGSESRCRPWRLDYPDHGALRQARRASRTGARQSFPRSKWFRRRHGRPWGPHRQTATPMRPGDTDKR